MCFAVIYKTCSDRYARGPALVGQPLVIRSRPVEGSKRNLAECRIYSEDGDLELTARAEVPFLRTAWTRLAPKRPGILALRTGRSVGGRAYVNVESPNDPALRWQYVDGLEIHVQYPARKWWGLARGWMLYFFVACVLAAMPMGRWLKVIF